MRVVSVLMSHVGEVIIVVAELETHAGGVDLAVEEQQGDGEEGLGDNVAYTVEDSLRCLGGSVSMRPIRECCVMYSPAR